MSSTRVVPKHEQAAYALEKFGIHDLSQLAEDWNPETHYTYGVFRPLTPGWPPRERSEYETPEGAWIVSEPGPRPLPPTRPSSPRASPVLLDVGEDQLLWDDPKAKCAFMVDEDKVEDIPVRHMQPLMAKLIKKVKLLRKENASLSSRNRALEAERDGARGAPQ